MWRSPQMLIISLFKKPMNSWWSNKLLKVHERAPFWLGRLRQKWHFFLPLVGQARGPTWQIGPSVRPLPNCPWFSLFYLENYSPLAFLEINLRRKCAPILHFLKCSQIFSLSPKLVLYWHYVKLFTVFIAIWRQGKIVFGLRNSLRNLSYGNLQGNL